MTELEEMFAEKHINKSLIRSSGLDGTNTMSGKEIGMQRKIQHVSPYALYINYRNHILALCLVHLIKEYPDLYAVDTRYFYLFGKSLAPYNRLYLKTPRLLKSRNQ